MRNFIDHAHIENELRQHIEPLKHARPAVSIFGSARFSYNHHYFKEAESLAKFLGNNGITIITGGGPGIMEAANKGVRAAGGKSCGLRITLPFEEYTNAYIDSDLYFQFKHFCTRKIAFVMHSDAFVVFPGGFGTLDELYECLVNMQNQKLHAVPIYLIGTQFWKGMDDWIRGSLVEEGVIDYKDSELFRVTDDLEWVRNELIEQLELKYSD